MRMPSWVSIVLAAGCRAAATEPHDDSRTLDDESSPSGDSAPDSIDDTAISDDSDDSGTTCEKITWYRDYDGDGFGDPAVSESECTAPEGFVLDSTDCDDVHAGKYPGAAEHLTDGLDNDCDGVASSSRVADLGVWQAVGSHEYAKLGVTLESNGDFNADGVADLVIGGSTGMLGDEPRGGTVLIYDGPLTVTTDPVVESTAGTALQGARLDGSSIVCGVGDLDGDGFDDLVSGAPGANGNGTGVAYIVRGPLTGVIDLSVDTQSFHGSGYGQAMGVCAGPGDVNGDGLTDLVLSTSESGADEPSVGAAYLLLGPVSAETVDAADQVLQGDENGEHIGYSVAEVGDVNGDGSGDYSIANGDFTGSLTDGVSNYVVTDYVTGTMHPRDVGVTVHYDLLDGTESMLASRVGDVNGDGYDDIAFGTDGNGGSSQMMVLAGPFGSAPDLDLSIAAPFTFRASSGGPELWMSFATTLGDWNGDGTGAFAVAAAQFAPPEALSKFDCKEDIGKCANGAVFVIANPIEPGVYDLATAADQIVGSYDGGYLGGGVMGPALQGGFDLSGDGLPDFALAAWNATTSSNHEGSAYVIFGGLGP
jgi:glycosylphosphatidylinositol phospholipase D